MCYYWQYLFFLYITVAGSIPAGVNGFFIDIKCFRSHYGPGVDSSSNRNEYQEYFLGVKGGRYVRLTTLPPSWAVVTKSGSLNFLEPSGPVQACNGTALPFYISQFLKFSQQSSCLHRASMTIKHFIIQLMHNM